jgi:hypothetical protein
MPIDSASRQALHELIELLQEVDTHWCSEERNLGSPEDVAGSHRALMHILEAALVGYFDKEARLPDFRRIVTPSRKLTGDNPDAIYFDAPVDPSCTYRIDGEMNGAVYFSMTLEADADSDRISETCGVINDTEIDIDEDGRFNIYLGGNERQRNWLPLDERASRITTRHYFEQETAAAVDPNLEPRMRITCTSEPVEVAPPNDESIAAGIRRVANVVRSRTLNMPAMASAEMPSFMSTVPNSFPTPQLPGEHGLAAADAHYSMAPFFLDHDEALVISGRWPDCRFANVCLWNRFQQTFDYRTRSVSLNRVQTIPEPDGSFRMVLAHEDPRLPNWLDTEGNPFGLVFWRFFLVEGEVEAPQAEVVKLSDLR